MSQEAKTFIGIGIATLIIVIGGIFWVSRSPASNNSENTPAIDQSLLVRDDSTRIATDSARVTLVEFGDYQCPACASFDPSVKQLVNKYKTGLNFVYRHFPLPQHKNAFGASLAAEAAGRQGKYWEMHELLYKNQTAWSEDNNAKDKFVAYAASLGLDMAKFEADFNDATIKQKIERDKDDGNLAGVNSTPTFFINGKKIENQSLTTLESLVEKELEGK